MPHVPLVSVQSLQPHETPDLLLVGGAGKDLLRSLPRALAARTELIKKSGHCRGSLP
jgi:hypothetical protein